ncbi:hypothetical protein BY996DRAFT_6419782 [Phakopsora pachyrhizi]|uniref:Uncharacterized protein n=1 Tax=Phakopsora pachyrhizi TaxID=170000 RepID=A0AAV0B602_PHAPC|nr:hypothetical protein BY996DRAFT_6423442 [Phakopsora pachyrhizi]KAI8448407.1 hypothetical protein BY996DRAFT_6419782 [Phakopsora pachyrhizi]CAH7681488.1 hypothetical protein PPACK8108_LOCUS14092 [Phakopsora pachyrhizi]CAH7684402.1 hypothetical protein PPACK8108_LOCUS18581 [Phakopsora pachyrhizi]
MLTLVGKILILTLASLVTIINSSNFEFFHSHSSLVGYIQPAIFSKTENGKTSSITLTRKLNGELRVKSVKGFENMRVTVKEGEKSAEFRINSNGKSSHNRLWIGSNKNNLVTVKIERVMKDDYDTPPSSPTFENYIVNTPTTPISSDNILFEPDGDRLKVEYVEPK